MKRILPMVLAVMLLCGCGKETKIDYLQRHLPEPDAIVVTQDTTNLTYEPDTPEYEKLVEALSRNWWRVRGENGLVEAASLAELRTTSERTYVSKDDTFVKFLYADTISWTQDNGENLAIQTVAFLIPDVQDALLDVEGCFTVAKTENIGYNEGLFTYYYPAEMASGFWDFLMH